MEQIYENLLILSIIIVTGVKVVGKIDIILMLIGLVSLISWVLYINGMLYISIIILWIFISSIILLFVISIMLEDGYMTCPHRGRSEARGRDKIETSLNEKSRNGRYFWIILTMSGGVIWGRILKEGKRIERDCNWDSSELVEEISTRIYLYTGNIELLNSMGIIIIIAMIAIIMIVL